MEVEEEELALDQQRQVRVGVEAANVRRVPPRTLQQSMVVAEVVPGQPLQVLDLLVEVLAGVDAHLQRPVQVFGPVMAVLAVLLVVVSHPQIVHPMAVLAARALGRHPGLLSVVVEPPVLPVVPVLPLPLVVSLARAEEVVVAAAAGMAVMVVRAVVALVVAAEVLAVAHTQQAPVVSAVMDGH